MVQKEKNESISKPPVERKKETSQRATQEKSCNGCVSISSESICQIYLRDAHGHKRSQPDPTTFAEIKSEHFTQSSLLLPSPTKTDDNGHGVIIIPHHHTAQVEAALQGTHSLH